MSSSLNQPFSESNCSAKQNGKKDYMVINCDENVLEEKLNESDNHGTSSSNRQQSLKEFKLNKFKDALSQASKAFKDGLSAKSMRSQVISQLLLFSVLNQANIKNFALLIAATFIQSFVALFLINRNQSKIPFDVIVKYFASGFCFAPLALFVLFFLTILAIFVLSFLFVLLFRPFYFLILWLLVFVLFVSYFAITATIQERCKYYAFFTVDLPYLVTPTSSISSHLRLPDSLEIDVNEAIPLGSRIRQRIVGNNRELSSDDYDEMNYPKTMDKPSESNTILSTGTKITVAMMSVAVGFACNMSLWLVAFSSIYHPDLGLAILLLRAMLLPKDLLCAAIQSIGIRRRFLEDDKSFTMSRTLEPAILLHMSFYVVVTFVLIFHLGNPSEILQLVPRSAIVIIIAGFCYFLVQSSAQKERLRYFITRA